MKTVIGSWTNQLSNIRDLGRNCIFLGCCSVQLFTNHWMAVYTHICQYKISFSHPPPTHPSAFKSSSSQQTNWICFLSVSCILSWGNPILKFLNSEIQQRADIDSLCSGIKWILEIIVETKATQKHLLVMHCYKKHRPISYMKYEDELL